MKSLICVLSLLVINVLAKDLPSYIPKCSLNDPDLNGCIKDKANKVLPTIVKGDPDFGFPSLSPINVKEIILAGDNLKVTLTDASTDDLKKVKLTEALFDLKNKKTGYTAFIDSIVVTAKYSVKDGKIASRSASGSGKYNMTYVGVTIRCKSDINVIEKDGDQYVQFENPTCDTDIEHGYFHFENLKSPEGEDLNEFVDKNWEAVWKEIKPSQDKAFAQFLTLPLKVVAENVPLSKLFT